MTDRMTHDERLNLKKLINEMGSEDNTDTIRHLKHSVLIRDNIRMLERLKTEHATVRASDPEEFFNIVYKECQFLYDNYTDIFTRCMKDEIDLTIMTKILIVLKMIEDEKVDQHEGSVMVGKYLKELYLDSAVKRANHLDEEQDAMRIQPEEGKNISWSNYKKSL
jgi:hypothetical protein